MSNPIDYLKLAYKTAVNSPDLSNQTGAVVVNNDLILGIGCGQLLEPGSSIR